MTKAELIAAIAQGCSEWDALISSIPRERMTEPGVNGEWSIKDIVAHVAWYEWWTAEFIRTRDWPELPPHLDSPDIATRNHAYFIEMRDAPLDAVLADARRWHGELINAIEGISDAEYADQTLLGMPPDPSWAIAAWVPTTYEHYAHHAPDIRRWLQSSVGA